MQECVEAAPVASAESASAAWALVASAANVYQRLAERRILACVFVCALTLGVRAALLPWVHVPKPVAQDEFGYLLAADTYTSGRLANPTPPFWEHFESFHILQKPTYAAKYQPVQGLVLAFGQKFFGVPWVGVWLSVGLMCGLTCWMLQGWVAPGWALLGALLLAMRIGIGTYWMNSYWGGAVAAIGGALIFGALPRIGLRRQFGHAATLGLGIAILIESRPYDGAVLTVLATLCLAWWLLLKGRVKFEYALRRVVLPIAGILLVTAVWMAYFNYRVTGNPLELPYQEHEKQYAAAPALAWGELHPEKVYRHDIMRRYWTEWGIPIVTLVKTSPITCFVVQMICVYRFFFGMLGLLLPAVLWLYPLKTKGERMALALVAGFLLSLAPLTGYNAHYAAAGTSLLYLFLVQGMARMRAWRFHGKQVGLALVVCSVLLFPCELGEYLAMAIPDGGFIRPVVRAREQVVNTLDAIPGGHVVMLRYSPDHCVHREWVYNLANIDQQRISWAHEMGPQWDPAFVEHYRDRHAWILEPDQWPPRLTPFAEASPFVAPKPPAQVSSNILESKTCPPELPRLYLIEPTSL